MLGVPTVDVALYGQIYLGKRSYRELQYGLTQRVQVAYDERATLAFLFYMQRPTALFSLQNSSINKV